MNKSSPVYVPKSQQQQQQQNVLNQQQQPPVTVQPPTLPVSSGNNNNNSTSSTVQPTATPSPLPSPSTTKKVHAKEGRKPVKKQQESKESTPTTTTPTDDQGKKQDPKQTKEPKATVKKIAKKTEFVPKAVSPPPASPTATTSTTTTGQVVDKSSPPTTTSTTSTTTNTTSPTTNTPQQPPARGKPAREPKEKKPKPPKPTPTTAKSSKSADTTSTTTTTTTSTTTTTPVPPKPTKEKKPKQPSKQNGKPATSIQKKESPEEIQKKKEEEEKRLEQERLEKERKLEEERIRLEQELKKKEEEEAKRIEQERIEKEKEEKLNQERFLKLKEELLQLQQLRNDNMKVNQDASIRNSYVLDSNFKKVSNFVKKMKTISEIDNKDSIISEITQLNLQKYTTEIVPSILKSTFKAADIPVIVKIFSLLHQRYDDVDACIQESIFNLFQSTLAPLTTDTENEKVAKITKRRSLIRLMVDLFYVDILKQFNPILKLVVKLIKDSTFEQDKEMGYPTLLILISFIRPCAPLIGLTSKKEKVQNLPDIYNNILPADIQASVKELIMSFFTKISQYLQKEFQLLKEKEKELNSLLVTKGEVPESFQTSYDSMRRNYEKLITNITIYAELIGAPLPTSEYSTKLETETIEQKILDRVEAFEHPFENEDQRKFYEQLVNVKEFKKTMDHSVAATTRQDEKAKIKLEKKNWSESEKKAMKSKKTQGVEEVVSRLKQNPLKASIIDTSSTEFLKHNLRLSNKIDFQKMIMTARHDQIPYYCRFLANLNQLHSHREYVNGIAQYVQDDLTRLIQSKSQMLLDVKLRDITIVGELVKFKILPSGIAFNYLKLCFDDFTHHNVDIACTLLEVSGRYLYKLPEAQFRLKNMLDILIRNKNAKMMDPRQESMIDNAYLVCRPMVHENKEVDTIKQFTKFLIFKHLNEDTSKLVLEKLLQLPWPKCETYLMKYLLSVQKGRFGNIYLIADIIYKLRKYYPNFVNRVIWQLMEDITTGFERNDFNQNQKRIMQATLFGELYNSMLLSTYHVFSLLHSALEYGYSTIHLFPINAEREREFLKKYRYKPNLEDFDPVNDNFRIRFICSLILVCKDCFSDQEMKDYLKPYLLFLQRYTLTKNLSLELEFMLQDCLSSVSGLQIFKSFEEANEECMKLGQLKLPSMDDKKPSAQVSPQTSSSSQQGENDEDQTVSHRRKDIQQIQKEEEERELEEQKERERQIALKQHHQQQQQQEENQDDLDFLNEFKKTIQESYKGDKTNVKLNLPSLLHNRPESPTNVSPSYTSPILPESILDIDVNNNNNNGDNNSGSTGFSQPSNNVPFTFLMKKGNKAMMKTIDIPQDISFVSQIKMAKLEEQRIIQENKKAVLKLAQNQT